MNKKLAVGIAIAITFGCAGAQGLKDAKEVFRSGHWKVLRSIDQMTDKATCTGIYKENYGIQLAPNNLLISVRGGLQSITLRYGDEPARPMRLATDIEKKVSVIDISGGDLSELLEFDRLRTSVLTLVRGVDSQDISLTGFKDALENIRDGCPDLGERKKDMQASNTEQKKLPTTECSDALVARMKAYGVKDRQIRMICGR